MHSFRETGSLAETPRANLSLTPTQIVGRVTGSNIVGDFDKKNNFPMPVLGFSIIYSHPHLERLALWLCETRLLPFTSTVKGGHRLTARRLQGTRP